MKRVNSTLAVAALAGLLAGCGGGSHSLTPATPGAPTGNSTGGSTPGAAPGMAYTGPAIQAKGNALVTKTIDVQIGGTPPGSKTSSLHGKANPLFIPTGMAAVTVFVFQEPNVAGQPAYYTEATCAPIPNPTAPVPAVLPIQVAMPVGNDYVVVAASSGGCAAPPATGALPPGVINAITNAPLHAPWAPYPSGSTQWMTNPVFGSESTGTFTTQSDAGPFVVLPLSGVGGGILNFIGSYFLGYPIAFTQNLTGSLSTAPGSAFHIFEMDYPGGPVTNAMGLPTVLTFTGPGTGAAAQPPGAPLDHSVCFTITDNSVNAVDGTLSLAFYGAAEGGLISGPVHTTGTPPVATICTSVVFFADEQLVIQYDGVNQDFFQTASMVVTYNGSTIAGVSTPFTVSNQPQVETVTLTPSANGPFNPYGVSDNAASVVDIADNTNSVPSVGQVVEVQGIGDFTTVAPTGSYGATTISAPWFNGDQPNLTSQIANFSPIVEGTGPIMTTWVGDPGCAGCANATSLGVTAFFGIYAFHTGAISGTAPAPVAFSSGTAPFQSTAITPFWAGPTGLTYIPVGVPGVSDATACPASTPCPAGLLFVTANNSLYRMAMLSNVVVGTATLLAGTGLAGPNGEASGSAGFNFLSGAAGNFIGITSDFDVTHNTASTIYLVDPGNSRIAAIPIHTATSGAISTIAAAPGAVGITYDFVSGLLYTTNTNSTVTSFNPASAPSGTGTLFAGSGSSGTNDGLGLQAYPVQFNPGNAISLSGGGLNVPQYTGGSFIANTNAAFQLAAGVTAYAAAFSQPTGIVYDPSTGFFYVVDHGSKKLRVVF